MKGFLKKYSIQIDSQKVHNKFVMHFYVENTNNKQKFDKIIQIQKNRYF